MGGRQSGGESGEIGTRVRRGGECVQIARRAAAHVSLPFEIAGDNHGEEPKEV